MDSLQVAGVVEVKRDHVPMLRKVSLTHDPEEVRKVLQDQPLYGSIIDDEECLI